MGHPQGGRRDIFLVDEFGCFVHGSFNEGEGFFGGVGGFLIREVRGVHGIHEEYEKFTGKFEVLPHWRSS